MILRAFLFAFTRDHDVIDDGIAGLQHTEDRLPIAGESIKTAVSLLDSMIARKIDLQKMVHGKKNADEVTRRRILFIY